MPTIAKLPSGSWRAQARRKGRYVSETFLRRDDALRWSRLAELSVDRNETLVSARIGRLTKFGELVKPHIEDMTAVGKPPQRSKAATLEMLQRELEAIKITALDRERLIQFGRSQSEAGAGPVTLGIDIGTIGLVLSHAAAVHGLPISTEQVALARIALKRLGLIGKGTERDRSPTQDEVEAPIALFEGNERQIIPITRIIRFAIAAFIGQVHRAITRDDKDLAIKVQYPEVQVSFDCDVDSVATPLRLPGILPRSMDLSPLLAEAKRQLHAEADYLAEAQHLARFSALMEGSDTFVLPRVGACRLAPNDRSLSQPYDSAALKFRRRASCPRAIN